jgi:hypothetical protein
VANFFGFEHPPELGYYIEGGNLALASYDDIFDVSAGNTDGERIVQIPLSELFPPEFHPFQVNDDDAMYRLAVSIKNEGSENRVSSAPAPRVVMNSLAAIGARELAKLPGFPPCRSLSARLTMIMPRSLW